MLVSLIIKHLTTISFLDVRKTMFQVFSSVGMATTLPCVNAVSPNCSSTSWFHRPSEFKSRTAVFRHGEISPTVTTHTAERLSLLPDCSLHIADVKTEDAGVYSCLQRPTEAENKNAADAPVHLIVLHCKFPSLSLKGHNCKMMCTF